MTTTRDKNAALRVIECERNLRSLEQAALEAALKGTASVSITSGGGSKSTTRLTPEQISKEIAYWKAEKASAMNKLSLRRNGIRSVMILRS